MIEAQNYINQSATIYNHNPCVLNCLSEVQPDVDLHATWALQMWYSSLPKHIVISNQAEIKESLGLPKLKALGNCFDLQRGNICEV